MASNILANSNSSSSESERISGNDRMVFTNLDLRKSIQSLLEIPDTNCALINDFQKALTMGDLIQYLKMAKKIGEESGMAKNELFYQEELRLMQSRMDIQDKTLLFLKSQLQKFQEKIGGSQIPDISQDELQHELEILERKEWEY